MSTNKLKLAANRNAGVGSRIIADSDSDSDSDFYPQADNNNDDNTPKTSSEPEPDDDCPWKSVEDPTSGKTYYYHIKTRETQWRKPMEMASREEREAIAAKEVRQKNFFAAMEANILNTISQGFKAPEKRNRLDLEFENQEISEDPLDVATAPAVVSGKHLPPLSSYATRGGGGSSASSSRTRPDLVRTISSMDASVISELIKRVPSSRHVVRGVPQTGMGRQQSNMSLGRGSSHHSGSFRKGRIIRGVGAGAGTAVVKKIGRLPNKDDDDALPPLTVVTTPDLRQRDGIRKDASALAAQQNPRDSMIRRDSLTLDQLTGSLGGSFGSIGNLGDSNFFENNGSRFCFSNNSFNLDDSGTNHSGGLLSHLSSSHNRSQSGFGGSFNSLDSGEGGLSGGGGSISVASNLLPVEEGFDESEFDNSPGLKVDTTNEIVLECEEEDEDSPEEKSFSFGAESGDNQEATTANWLDALPADNATESEEIVGYGTDAKPFKDAGFTSFFDESMANFDLSDKETQALQKLAIMSEQMTNVLETGEDSEDSEDDESSVSDDFEDDMMDLNQGGPVEYELNFGDSEEETEDDGGNLSPSMHTPITAGTTKTTGTVSTTASADSPFRKPTPRRTMGTKTGGTPRQLKSTEPLDEHDDKDIILRGSLHIGGLALTTDNARSHVSETNEHGDKDIVQRGNLPIGGLALTADNARSHVSETTHGSMSGRQTATRRNTGGGAVGERWSGRNLMDGDLNNSSSSIHSTSSKSMANAARRLSLFRLKSVDKIRLRPVGKDKLPRQPNEAGTRGSQQHSAPPKGGDMETRPELVRRNTCGTLYVGATMSAPDKDATIKCVCGVFRAHILQSGIAEDSPDFTNFRIFNDLESQQKQGAKRRGAENQRFPGALPVPSLDQITTFYRDVFKRAQMEYDCIIISLIYVERLIKTTNGALRPRVCNWRSILFSCMVLASKVWDDLSMWNADFSQTCPNGVKFPLKRINELEVAILSALSYKVKVPASEYAKYYFLLRSMLIKSGLGGDDVDTTTPLDLEGAKRLQQVSTQFQAGIGQTRRQMRKAKSMRSKSMGEDERQKLCAGARIARSKNKKVNLEQIVNY